jgi:hypothetical protein
MLVLTHVFGDVTLRRASMGLLCFIDTLGTSSYFLLKNGPRVCPGAFLYPRLVPLLVKAMPPCTHRTTVWQVVPHPQRPVSLNALFCRKALSMLSVVESAKFSFARPRR